MRNGYMTVETTFVPRSVCYSLQSTANIENGAIVGKGTLVDNEDSVYNALTDYTDGMYLVANPAWSYDDSRVVNQNEENFINKAGIAFRTYKLEKNYKFKIANVDGTFEKGDYVEFKDGKYEKADAATVLQVVGVEEVGFPYCIGSAGTKVAGDTSNTYGYALDTRVVKYTIEVVA